MNIEIFS